MSAVVTAACSDVGVPCRISASTLTRPNPPLAPQYALTPIPPSPPWAVTDDWPVKSCPVIDTFRRKSQSTQWHQFALTQIYIIYRFLSVYWSYTDFYLYIALIHNYFFLYLANACIYWCNYKINYRDLYTDCEREVRKDGNWYSLTLDS